MKSYPLKSLTIAEAQEMQFRLVDEITKVFPGNEILTRGDLGVVKGLNQPVYTRKVEKVIANFFNTDEALLVRGSGTNAIRLALHVGVNRKKKILIHDAPIYPTTNVSFEMLREIEKRGYEDKVFLSMDITRKANLEYQGGIGYSYLLDRFVPMLREGGVSDKFIRKMLVENPKRFLVRSKR